MSMAVPVFFSFGGGKTVIVGFVTFVIHLAALVGESFGSRTRSAPMGPEKPMPLSGGTFPGHTFSTTGASGPDAWHGANKQATNSKRVASPFIALARFRSAHVPLDHVG